MKNAISFSWVLFFAAVIGFANDTEEALLERLRSHDTEEQTVAAEELGKLHPSWKAIKVLKKWLWKGTRDEQNGAALTFGEMVPLSKENLKFLRKRLQWEVTHGRDISLILILQHSIRERVPQSTSCQSLSKVIE